MTKLEMAHEYAKIYLKQWCEGNIDFNDVEHLSDAAYLLADAMQAEAEKRSDMERPAVLQNEWQLDWSVAPVKTVAWRKTEYNEFEWLLELRGEFYYNGKAPDFGYQGSWENSLRKRP